MDTDASMDVCNLPLSPDLFPDHGFIPRGVGVHDQGSRERIPQSVFSSQLLASERRVVRDAWRASRDPDRGMHKTHCTIQATATSRQRLRVLRVFLQIGRGGIRRDWPCRAAATQDAAHSIVLEKEHPTPRPRARRAGGGVCPTAGAPTPGGASGATAWQGSNES